MATTDLELRVRRLERLNLTLIVALALAVCAAASRNQDEVKYKTVFAQNFQVVDAKGQTLGVFGTTENPEAPAAVSLSMFGRKKGGLTIFVSKDNTAGIQLTGGDGSHIDMSTRKDKPPLMAISGPKNEVLFVKP